MKPLAPIPPAAIEAAARRLVGVVLRTPLVPYERGADRALHLKAEGLQPIGSFKLRGAENALACAAPASLARGVWTASAGNMSQGLAYAARARGIPCHVLVPEGAPRTKLRATEALGAESHAVPRERWWRALEEHAFEGWDGLFVHPVANADVIAGNGTIGLELLAELPEVDHVLVPFGGGGLLAGIASALRAHGSRAAVHACEVAGAAPLAAALERGAPVRIEAQKSFVDGIGGSGVLEAMWPLVSDLARGSIVVSPAEIAAAIRLLAARGLVAEGAGAAALAAALSAQGSALRGTIVCILSGANLDPETLARILEGELPA